MNEQIETNPKIMLGKPVIKGTRITVELLLRQLRQGLSIENILENYPHLNRGQIDAALDYAADLVKDESVYPLKYEIDARLPA
ncbi:MAG TPA: DUF433 domain-containing protein [Candidatus Paceibacterota bacterium]